MKRQDYEKLLHQRNVFTDAINRICKKEGELSGEQKILLLKEFEVDPIVMAARSESEKLKVIQEIIFNDHYQSLFRNIRATIELMVSYQKENSDAGSLDLDKGIKKCIDGYLELKDSQFRKNFEKLKLTEHNQSVSQSMGHKIDDKVFEPYGLGKEALSLLTRSSIIEEIEFVHRALGHNAFGRGIPSHECLITYIRETTEFLNKYHKYTEGKFINLSDVNIEGFNLSDLDLSNVKFETTSLKNVDVRSAIFDVSKLVKSKSLSGLNIDEDKYQLLQEERKNYLILCKDKLLQNLKNVEYKILNLDVLYKFSFESHELEGIEDRIKAISNKLDYLDEQMLRAASFFIFSSSGIQANTAKICRDEEVFRSKTREEIYQEFSDLLGERKDYLPNEVISEIINVKFAQLYGYIKDTASMFLCDVKNMSKDLTHEVQIEFKKGLEVVEEYRQLLLSRKKGLEEAVDRKLFEVHIDSLTAPEDPVLHNTPESRLEIVLNFAKKHNWVVDLRDKDLTGVSFKDLDIKGSILLMTGEQESNCLSSKQKREKYTKFFEFVEKGNIEKVDELLKIGYSINHQDEAGRTALMKSAFSGQLETTKFLLSKGANAELCTSTGWNIIQGLCRYKAANKEIVYYLLENTGLQMDAYSAVALGDVSMIESFSDDILKSKDLTGETAIHIAILQHTGEALESILEVLKKKGVSFNAVANGMTPLDLACELSDVDCIRYLVGKVKVDISQGSLLIALEKNNVEVLRYLVEKSSELEIALEVPIEVRVFLKDKEVIEPGLELSSLVKIYHLCCKHDWAEGVAMLLDMFGGERFLDIRDSGDRGIDIACDSGSVNVLKLLGERKALGNLNDGTGSFQHVSSSSSLGSFESSRKLKSSATALPAKVAETSSSVAAHYATDISTDTATSHSRVKSQSKVLKFFTNLKHHSSASSAVEHGGSATEVKGALASSSSDFVGSPGSRSSLDSGVFLASSVLDSTTKVSSSIPPLFRSINKGFVQIAKILLENGANPNASYATKPLLFYAINSKKNPVEMTELLLKYGANILIQDSLGNGVLHYAALADRYNIELFEILKVGFIENHNAEKKSACDIAKEKGLEEGLKKTFTLADHKDLPEGTEEYTGFTNLDLLESYIYSLFAPVTKGIKVTDVEHDGNCFFHAVEKQLGKVADDGVPAMNYKELRSFAARYVSEHKEKFKDFIAEEDAETYITRIEHNKEWADNVLIRALALELRMNIVIIQPGKLGAPIIIPEEQVQSSSVFLYHIPESHYKSIESLSISEPEVRGLIERLREKGIEVPEMLIRHDAEEEEGVGGPDDECGEFVGSIGESKSIVKEKFASTSVSTTSVPADFESSTHTLSSSSSSSSSSSFSSSSSSSSSNSRETGQRESANASTRLDVSAGAAEIVVSDEAAFIDLATAKVGISGEIASVEV